MQAERGREPSRTRAGRAFSVARRRGDARGVCPPQAAVNLLVVAAYKWPGSGDGNRFRGGAPGPTRRYKVSGFELVAGTLALHAAAPPRRILRACG